MVQVRRTRWHSTTTRPGRPARHSLVERHIGAGTEPPRFRPEDRGAATGSSGTAGPVGSAAASAGNPSAGHDTGPPTSRSNATRGIRNWPPIRTTPNPSAPPEAKSLRTSSHAVIRPIRSTAAASVAVNRSRALINTSRLDERADSIGTASRPGPRPGARPASHRTVIFAVTTGLNTGSTRSGRRQAPKCS